MNLQKLLGKSLCKRYDASYMVFDNYPRTSRTPRFWHMYVILYGNFMVIVKPCEVRDVCNGRFGLAGILFEIGKSL